MKKKTVATLKVTRKLEDILPAFLCCFADPVTIIKRSCSTATPPLYTPSGNRRNISAIFQIYRRFLHLYQRFFHYIDVSTQNIDLPTSFDTKDVQHTYPPSNLLPNSTIKKITSKIASIFNATYATLKTA